jgi:hypothetical protein
MSATSAVKSFPKVVFYDFIDNKVILNSKLKTFLKISSYTLNGFNEVFTQKEYYTLPHDEMYIIGIQYDKGDIQICFTGKINELESNDELKNKKDNSSIGVDREFAQEGGITIKPEYHRRIQ